MPYAIHEDVKFGPLEVIDVGGLAADCKEPWWNQSLCRVNDSVARVGVFHGEFHWHKHDLEDELFVCLEGHFLIDVEDRPTVQLAPLQAFMVPRGIVHRTRSPERSVVLMVEAATVKPTGD